MKIDTVTKCFWSKNCPQNICILETENFTKSTKTDALKCENTVPFSIYEIYNINFTALPIK